MSAGYNVRVRNFYNGSTYASRCVDGWNTAAATTTAGAVAVPNPGDQILLGDSAKLTVVAVNGRIIGGGTVQVQDENDRARNAVRFDVPEQRRRSSKSPRGNSSAAGVPNRFNAVAIR